MPQKLSQKKTAWLFAKMKKSKLLNKLLSGSRNIRFADAVKFAEMFGFN